MLFWLKTRTGFTSLQPFTAFMMPNPLAISTSAPIVSSNPGVSHKINVFSPIPGKFFSGMWSGLIYLVSELVVQPIFKPFLPPLGSTSMNWISFPLYIFLFMNIGREDKYEIVVDFPAPVPPSRIMID